MLLNFAIAEDVAADAQALGRALQSAAAGLCELSLRFFESGDALLQSPAPTEYDAVFLDILMPGMNGVETAQRLRELSPRLPLIFITASGDYIWQALPVHPFDYLLKPLRSCWAICCVSRSMSSARSRCAATERAFAFRSTASSISRRRTTRSPS